MCGSISGSVIDLLGAPLWASLLTHGSVEGDELCVPGFESQLLGTMASQLQDLAHRLAHSRHSGSTGTFRKDERVGWLFG